MNGYELSRSWFDFSFENPDICTTNHHALFYWVCEKWNRVGQKEKFSLPSDEAMEALSIKSKSTFYKTLNDLVEWKWLLIVSESKNQHTAKVVTLNKKMIRHTNGTRTALDAAITRQSLGTVPIIEQGNNGTKEQENKVTQQVAFSEFWDLYAKKIDRPKIEKKWAAMKYEDQLKVMAHLPEYVRSTPEKKYRKNPESYLNSMAWENEILYEGNKSQPQKTKTAQSLRNVPNAQIYYMDCLIEKIRPVRWEDGKELSDEEIEQMHIIHKVGNHQYA